MPLDAAIARLPPLREVIADHGLAARRSLGQHFLLDMNLTHRIAALAGDLSQANIVEIGSGPGGLTRALLASGAKRVFAIERDPRCVAALASLGDVAGDRLQVIEADALTIALPDMVPPPRIIVSNLPYNVATPLLIGWLRTIRAYRSLTLMFQREVADRLAAVPGTKAYGRLSVMAQWCCVVERRMTLPAKAFTPPPKVDSAVVRMTPHEAGAGPAWTAMERVVGAAFGQRRKMLRQSLGGFAGLTSALEATGLVPTQRAETVAVQQYADLTGHLFSPDGEDGDRSTD